LISETSNVDAYLNERSVIFNEEMIGGQERVTTDKDRVLRGAQDRLGCEGIAR